jgi:PAS domain S-box-containing protein
MHSSLLNVVFYRLSLMYLWLINITVVAFGYFIVGWLASFLAISPGYASPLWPSAGVALSAVLILGYRIWPGILLGSFLINISISLTYNSQLTAAFIIAIIISSGATLQALVGGYLLKRYANVPNDLVKEKDIFRFYIFGAFLSPIVNSTLSVNFLSFIQMIPTTGSYWINWGVWWLGDAIGILIFTPIILLWASRSSENLESRKYAITVPVILMFAIAVYVTRYQFVRESEKAELLFKQQAFILESSLRESISLNTNILSSLASFYHASEKVDRHEFKNFVDYSLKNYKSIKALSWSPVVPFDKKAIFEKKMSLEGFDGFKITECCSNGDKVNVTDREEYAPVEFIEPLNENLDALGFDVISDVIRNEAAVRARDTGEIAVTDRIKLVQSNDEYGRLAFLPIYKNTINYKTIFERRNNIRGYVIATFLDNYIAYSVQNNLNHQTLVYQLTDITNHESPSLIYSNIVKPNGTANINKKSLLGNNKLLTYRSTMLFGGRKWLIHIVPTQDFYYYHQSNYAYYTLIGGLLLASITGVLIMLSFGRRHILQEIIKESENIANELAISKNNLEKEVAARTEALNLTLSKLKISDERYELAINASNDGIWDWDLETNNTYFNSNYYTMLGFEKGELSENIQACFLELIHPNEISYVLDTTAHFLNGDGGAEIEFQMRCKHGYYKWILTRRQIVKRDLNGRPVRVVGTHTDVTARNQLKYIVMQNEKDLHTIFAQIPDGIVAFDDNQKISHVNRLFSIFTGYDHDALIGISESDFLIQLRQLGGSACQDNILDSRNDSIVQVSRIKEKFLEIHEPVYRILQISCVDLIQDRISKIVHFRDVTLEKLLDKEKSEFLTTAAHELRTPMTIIMGNAELLKYKKIKKDTQEYMLSIVYEQSLSIVHLLDELLDISRIETLAGKAFNKENTAIMPILENISNSFMMVGDNRKVVFIPRLASLPELFLDKEKISQALKNCLSNAFKYSHGEVRLYVDLIDEYPRSEVIISIEDFGIGMTKEEVSHVFDKFYRANPYGTIPGTGLGMALVKEIVDHHNGMVLIQSAPGNTVVKIVLPVPK